MGQHRRNPAPQPGAPSPTEAEIRERAYRIYEQNGRVPTTPPGRRTRKNCRSAASSSFTW